MVIWKLDSEGLINQLNSFLGEWANQWLRHHSNTAAHVALNFESIRSRLLMTKLGFLRRRVGAEMMRVMSDDVESVYA